MSAPTAPKRKPRPHKPRPASQADEIQSAASGTPPPDGLVEFKGETYKISDKVGIWPLMQFSRAAESGIALGDYRALAALHAFLQDCIDPEDWGRFQENMISAKVDDVDELLACAQAVVEKMTSRPTQPPSGSSNGRPAPSATSTGASSSPAALESGG